MEVEKELILLCKEILTESETTYTQKQKVCPMCCGSDKLCTEAERVVHWVYHAAGNENSFWNVQGHTLTGEQILDSVRQTNAMYRKLSSGVYVCEHCFTQHAVFGDKTRPVETTEGRLVCEQCEMKKK